jgi:hypothetical protein
MLLNLGPSLLVCHATNAAELSAAAAEYSGAISGVIVLDVTNEDAACRADVMAAAQQIAGVKGAALHAVTIPSRVCSIFVPNELNNIVSSSFIMSIRKLFFLHIAS